MNKRKLISILMILTLMLTAGLATVAFAENSSSSVENVNASFTPGPNGTTGIATMTFDDGLIKTSDLLNALCREYGLRASIMLTKASFSRAGAHWADLFAQGYLEPESHTSGHINIKETTLTPEELKAEISDHRGYIQEQLPGYDVLTLAVPNSNYGAVQFTEVMKTYYASRSGLCVLSSSSLIGRMQSLNPADGYGYGQWYNPYMVRMQCDSAAYASTNSPEKIIEYLEKCINEQGWFISMCHGIVTGENLDTTEENLRPILAAMEKYQDAGKLWVASYTEATKYIRERQNSQISAYSQNGNYYVDVTMYETIGNKEGALPLPTSVFNLPLTVKLEVPSDWVRVSYTQANGESVTAKCFTGGTKNYVYVNAVPNGGTVTVTDATEEHERPDFIVGSEITPATAWTPTAQYDGILFGVWASEDDYVNGEAPDYWYQNKDASASNYATGLTGATIGVISYNVYCDEYKNAGFIPGFVRCYQDLATEGARITTGDTQSLVIDLGGHTLTDKFAFCLGGQSATKPTLHYEIKNGTVLRSGGGMYIRNDTSMVFRNLVYDATVGSVTEIFSDAGAEFIIWDTCILKIKATAGFTLTGNRTAPYQDYMIFKNTDLIQEGVPTRPLFTIRKNHIDQTNYKILFDKNSSVKRENADWVRLEEVPNASANAYPKFSFVQGLYFELGCQISPLAFPSYNMSYTAKLIEGTEVVTTTLKANTDGGWLEVAVVVPDEKGISYTHNEADAIATLSGTAIYNPNYKAKYSDPFLTSVFEANESFVDEKDLALTEAENGLSTIRLFSDLVWKPEGKYENILFGLWATEEDYLLGKAPTKWYSKVSTDENYREGLLGADIATTGDGLTYTDPSFIPGYLHLFGSINNTTAQIVIGDTQNLTINLGGFTMVNNIGFRVGGSFANHPKASLTIKNGSMTIATGQNQVRPQAKAYFENVNITTSKNNNEAIISDGGSALLQFKNCNLTFTNAKGGLMKYGGGSLEFINTKISYTVTPTAPLLFFTGTSSFKPIANATFDKDCVINMPANNWVSINASLVSIADVKVMFEAGITFNQAAIPDYTYTVGTEKKNCSDEDSICDISIVLADGQAAEKIYYLTLSNGMYSLIGDISMYKIIEFDATRKYIYNTWMGNVLDTGAKETAYKHQDGSVFVFYTDVSVADFATFYNHDVTFDLNGFTLTRTSANDFMLGAGDKSGLSTNLSGSFLERTVTIMNGTFVGAAGANTVLQARPGTTLILKDLTLNVHSNVINDGGIVLASFENCTLNSKNGGTVFSRAVSRYAFKEGTATGEYVFNKVAFNKLSVVSMTTPVQSPRVVETLNFKFFGGCVITNSRYLAALSAEEKYINIDFSLDTKFTDRRLPFVNLADTDIHVANVRFFADFEMDPVDVSKCVFRTDGEYYNLATTPSLASGTLQTNLTLHTDFTLNFYANSGLISALYMNGELLTAETIGGKDVYSISGISAATAADEIELMFMINYDGREYYVPTTYSVLTYAERVISNVKVSTLGKQLVTAAMEYVKAAYEYTGKTAPAFTGVAITAATAPTTTTANLPELIEGAQLSLGGNLKLRFTLAEGKSGTLKVGDATYIVENGKVGAVNYVEVDMRAYAFYNANIVVSDGTTTGTYTLAHYVNAVKGNSNAQLVGLVNAFYTYTKYANEYKATGELN